jgi:hypothetical protein
LRIVDDRGGEYIKIHLCFGWLRDCPGVCSPDQIESNLHSDTWRIRYPEDISEAWILNKVPDKLMDIVRNSQQDEGSIFETLEDLDALEDLAEEEPPPARKQSARLVPGKRKQSIFDEEPKQAKPVLRQRSTSRPPSQPRSAGVKARVVDLKDRLAKARAKARESGPTSSSATLPPAVRRSYPGSELPSRPPPPLPPPTEGSRSPRGVSGILAARAAGGSPTPTPVARGATEMLSDTPDR